MPRSKNPNPRQVMEGETAENSNDVDTEQEHSVAVSSDSTNQQHEETNINDNQTDQHNDEIQSDVVESSQILKRGESPTDVMAKRDALAKLTAQKFAAAYEVSKDSIGHDSFVPLDVHDVPASCDNNGQLNAKIKPINSLNFSTLSSSSFLSLVTNTNSQSRRRPPPLKKMGQVSNNFNYSTPVNGSKKSKSSSPGVLNPEVMTWMKNKFELRPGGRISASDIIELYRSDTKHLPNPPPGLHNYQVGQLLRRVFPNLTRCKITVNSRRLWVYRHLNLNENPPENIFEEQSNLINMNYEENGAFGADTIIEENCRASDSPMSNIEDDNSPSPASMEGDAEIRRTNDGKSNTILLELLGNKIKVEAKSPLSVDMNSSYGTSVRDYTFTQTNGTDEDLLPKKKRDSEVMEWLRENYKYKPGYYVKSMDLLRQYNNGREELVKYLSQVGRVMKHVFPSVRHLRKSFKGGKREWVYLHLKPIEIDSDSEEGRMMLLPMRNAPKLSSQLYTDFSKNSIVNPNPNPKHPITDWKDWKRERVNITHTPLTLVQNRNAIFKPKGGLYHRVSRMDGNKLIISRNPPDVTARSENSGLSLVKSSVQNSCDTNTLQLRSSKEHSLNRTRIILYNKKEMDKNGSQGSMHAPMEIEQDIFAPFNKLGNFIESSSLKKYAIKPQNLTMHKKTSELYEGSSNSATSGVFCRNRIVRENEFVTSPSSNHSNVSDQAEPGGVCWASKKLKLCAAETTTTVSTVGIDSNEKMNDSQAVDFESIGLDLSVKREANSSSEISINQSNTKHEKSNFETEEYTDVANAQLGGALNLIINTEQNSNHAQQLPDEEKPNTSQTIHYKPEAIIVNKIPTAKSMEERRLSADSDKGHFIIQRPGSKFKPIAPNPNDDKNLKRTYNEMNSAHQEIPITWNSLQNFNAQRYGWLRSPNTTWSSPRNSDINGRRMVRYVEWFLFSGQWLVNRQRALREIKIYDDWTVVIHALGRRVYPNDLGGITDLEKTASSLNKVFRVLAEAKLCMGFPAPSISDLYIHGILVSKFEVWSSREDSGEDIRQRAVNCQILYSGPGACCSKCARIMKLHQQQKRGAGAMKRANTELSSGADSQSKHLKI